MSEFYLHGAGWVDPCGCASTCGDDGDTEGPGVCKGLPRMPEPPLVRIVMVPRELALGENTTDTGGDE